MQLQEDALIIRPENTHRGAKAGESAYYNQLYWSEERTVAFSAVTGRCYVKFADLAVTDQMLEVWTEEGPNRWFFREWYNAEENSYEESLSSAQKMVRRAWEGWGKVQLLRLRTLQRIRQTIIQLFTVNKKLRFLDIFSGCGGLSHDL